MHWIFCKYLILYYCTLPLLPRRNLYSSSLIHISLCFSRIMSYISDTIPGWGCSHFWLLLLDLYSTCLFQFLKHSLLQLLLKWYNENIKWLDQYQSRNFFEGKDMTNLLQSFSIALVIYSFDGVKAFSTSILTGMASWEYQSVCCTVPVDNFFHGKYIRNLPHTLLLS